MGKIQLSMEGWGFGGGGNTKFSAPVNFMKEVRTNNVLSIPLETNPRGGDK